jgi:hypothetical protein
VPHLEELDKLVVSLRSIHSTPIKARYIYTVHKNNQHPALAVLLYLATNPFESKISQIYFFAVGLLAKICVKIILR